MKQFKDIFREFSAKVKSEFNTATFSVYSYEKNSNDGHPIRRASPAPLACGRENRRKRRGIDPASLNKAVRFFGENIKGEDIERYCSFSTTAILNSPTGLPEASEYKSRLVTRLFTEDNIVFIVVISSFRFEAFKNENGERILEMLKHLLIEKPPAQPKTVIEKPVKLRAERIPVSFQIPSFSIRKRILIIPAVSVLLIIAVIAIFFSFSDGTDSKTEPKSTTLPITAGVAKVEIASVVGLITAKTAPPSASTELEPPPPSVATTKKKAPKATNGGDGNPAISVISPSATQRATTSSRSNRTTTSRTTKTTSPPTRTTTQRPTSTTTRPTIPMPTSVKATANSNGSITFSWGVVSNADGYEVSRSTSSNSGFSTVNAVAIRDGSRVSITDSSVSKNTMYYYRVRAFRTVNGEKIFSSQSTVVSVTTR
jgi:hypothetical protein